MIIEGTKTTPNIYIEKGVLEIKGRSIPEDAFEFFSPVLHKIQFDLPLIDNKLEIKFHLEYINSGSKKYLSNILWLLDQIYSKGKEMVIYWYYDYDDDAMNELGNDYRTMVQIPFHIVEVK